MEINFTNAHTAEQWLGYCRVRTCSLFFFFLNQRTRTGITSQVGAEPELWLPYGVTSPDLALCRKVTNIYVMRKPCMAMRASARLQLGHLWGFQCRHQSPWISGNSCHSELTARAWILHIYIYINSKLFLSIHSLSSFTNNPSTIYVSILNVNNCEAVTLLRLSYHPDRWRSSSKTNLGPVRRLLQNMLC